MSTNTKNLLSPLGFKLIVERLPNVSFFVQNIPIPGISMSTVRQTTPFTDVNRPGDKVIFEPLNVTFLVDETLYDLIEIFNWITSAARSENFQQFKQLSQVTGNELPKGSSLVSDGSIAIMTNNFNPNVELKFKDMFPTQLSPPSLDTTVSGETTLTASVVFAYTTYQIARIT